MLTNLSPNAQKRLEERQANGIFPADPSKRWLHKTTINRSSEPLASASQRLRAVLFRVWQQSKERKGGMDQETYYQARMAQIIEQERKSLEPPLPTYEPMDG